MTMTAKELYEIVRDVPKDAWPTISYHLHLQEWHNHNDQPMLVDLAEAAFVGAMVAWLLDRGLFLCKSAVSGTYYAVDTNNVNHRFGNYKTPIEALTAACKATKQEDDDGN
jgi:hypothetical protein